jgi:Electron transfer DM13
MKRKFFILVGLSMTTIAMIGCTQQNTATPTTSLTAASSVAASPSPANSPTKETSKTSKVLSSGSFVDGEHPTSGTVRIVEKDGQRILELDETFETSTSGPDLVVVLHREPDVIGSTAPPTYPINEGDYVLLAPLQEYSGTQSYVIPENINLADFPSAVIWCRQFNATFGAARLQ